MFKPSDIRHVVLGRKPNLSGLRIDRRQEIDEDTVGIDVALRTEITLGVHTFVPESAIDRAKEQQAAALHDHLYGDIQRTLARLYYDARMLPNGNELADSINELREYVKCAS